MPADAAAATSSASMWPTGLFYRTLTQKDIADIASGRHQMDAFVRRYIHENLSYRFVMLSDGAAAYIVEAAIKSGEWEHGRPLLNPGG